MGQELLKDPKWWIKLVVNAVDLNGGSAILHLTKLLGGNKLSDDAAKQLAEHYNNIIRYIDDEILPIDIYGDGKNKMKLCNMYVSPSAELCIRNDNNLELDFGVESVDNLITGLMEKILRRTKTKKGIFTELLKNKPDRGKALIVVEGQPGHGKTSSMRMLARAIQAYDNQIKDESYITHTVLFYEMNKLNEHLGKTVIEILQSVTPFIDNKSFFNRRKTVLILDGLDERDLTDGSNEPFLKFIWNLQQLAAEFPIQLVFTGRTAFIQPMLSQFDNNPILFKIKDFTKGQLGEWLDNFKNIKKYTITEDMYDKNGLREFKGQPLLLTMIAIWLVDQEGQIDSGKNSKVNRSEIYDKIIRWSIKRKHQHLDVRSRPPTDNEINETLSKLQAIAFELFKKQTNTITTEILELNFERNKDIYNLIIPDRDEMKKYLGDLQVSFYFEGESTDSFQFIHKSFADYLTIQAIIDYCQEMASTYKPDRKESSLPKMADEVYRILGYSRLTMESHYEFLLEFQEANGEESNNLAEILHDFLCSMSKHRYLVANAGTVGGDPYLVESTVQHNLVFLFNLLKQVGADLPMNYSWHNYINCQHGSGTSINLIGADLMGANLRFANLEGAYLRFANLEGTNLSHANLSGTVLIGANLEDANLTRANLRFANLEGANFTDANLEGTNLEGTNLIDANLEGANFTDANLEGTNLEGTNLIDANLTDAVLLDAVLTGAVFNTKTRWPKGWTEEKLKRAGAIKQ